MQIDEYESHRRMRLWRTTQFFILLSIASIFLGLANLGQNIHDIINPPVDAEELTINQNTTT